MKYGIPAGTQIKDLTAEHDKILFDRGRAQDAQVAATVTELIADVRARGDDALRAQAQRFDKVENLTIDVPRSEWLAALNHLDKGLRTALETAASNIAKFHRAQVPTLLEMEMQPGVILGRRADPLARVAVYAPGGRAAYPSSVLMGVVPARMAGVAQVVVCSPAGTNGRPPESVLAACAIADADRLFAIGGAGAIGAAAYGTETVPRVDKIVGPGNAFVTEAKRQVSSVVGTDCPAGPSEVMVLADKTANVIAIVRELFAQAEHDPDAACVLVSTDRNIIDQVDQAIVKELTAEPRAKIIRAAMSTRGALLLADDHAQMLELAARYAPEHLVLYVAEPRSLLQRVRNVGTVFLGGGASVVFGDYLTGANHVLPTAGLARAYSGLSTLDFIRWTTYQDISVMAAKRMAATTETLANAEGLPAHAHAARSRAGGGK